MVNQTDNKKPLQQAQVNAYVKGRNEVRGMEGRAGGRSGRTYPHRETQSAASGDAIGMSFGNKWDFLETQQKLQILIEIEWYIHLQHERTVG